MNNSVNDSIGAAEAAQEIAEDKIAPMGWPEISRLMKENSAGDFDWFSEKNFTASYFANDEVVEVARKAFSRHIGDNITQRHALHPSLIGYENDCITFVQRILNAPKDSSATITTGGSESIMLAMKAARDRASAQNDILKPELIIPQSAYPVFNKAAHNLGIKVVQMQTSPDYQADVDGIRRAINKNTIMIAGSAPPFPFGVTDPIESLSELAVTNGIWLHVDTCIGGFVLPFAEALGRDVPVFDFRLPGVQSMSIDFHKYGYAMRGCSALVLRDRSLEKFQEYSFDVWPAGEYSSKNISGSRSGGPVASAWAVIQYLGYQGFLDQMKKILEVTDYLVSGINNIDGLHVEGNPEAVHFSFASESLNMFAIADGLVEKGWGINIGTKPPSILLMLSGQHNIAVANAFLDDIKEVVSQVISGLRKRDDNEELYKIF